MNTFALVRVRALPYSMFMGSPSFKFTRMELAGSLGDLGTILPLAVGLIMVNGLSPTGLFLSLGLMYVLGGLYYRVPIAVQPMKLVAAYALATACTPEQVTGAGLLLGVFLLVMGFTGLVDRFSRLVPRSVVRGVQLTTGMVLMIRGVEFMVGTSQLQAGGGEPWLAVGAFPLFGLAIPFSLILACVFLPLTLASLNSKRFPAGLVVVLGGLLVGLIFSVAGGLDAVRPGLHLPSLLPFGLPSGADLGFVALALVLPQIPMTLGNAVVANRDLSNQYYPEGEERVTARALCVSMGLGNLAAFLVGGMPMCHGAGGLAAHYRFGARTAGSNLIIGGLFVLLALLVGEGGLFLARLMPLGVLGVLLFFSGGQLALTILDMKDRSGLFVVVGMTGVALATNLAWAFGFGLLLAWFVDLKKIKI